MADITSANAVFLLSVQDVFPTPQILQGFATDDAFATGEVDVAEVMKGVDGFMSYGFVPFITHMNIVFQADSPSIPNTMEVWLSAELAVRRKFAANATITLAALGKVYQMVNGVVTRMTPIPPGKKILQPQSYAIAWDQWIPQPYSSI